MAEDRQPDDRERYRPIVHEEWPSVYRFLLHLTRDEVLAEDLTQETFVAAWRQFASFEQRSTIGTWLCRIAYGKFIDHTRRRRADARLTEKLKADSGKRVADANPIDRLFADERHRQLYTAVQALDDEDRVMIVLHYLQDRTFVEVAEILGQPVNTIKWRTTQALIHLRRLMEEREKS